MNLVIKNFESVGNWWNDKSIELVKIDGEVYALSGFNGESYLNSWKCSGEHYMDASEKEYTITPMYSEQLNDYDNFDIVGYKVISN